MKRFAVIVCMLAMLAGLTACNVQNPQEKSDVSETVSENDPDNSADNDPEKPEQPSDPGSSDGQPLGNEITAQFVLPNGDPADLTNAVVSGPGGDISLSEMTADNWIAVSCDYVYLAEPHGIFYNSVDNADVFDANELTFKNAPETVAYEYKKYKEGDKFGELTISYALTSFHQEMSGGSPKYFNGGDVMLDGQLALTGWCRLVTEGDCYTIYERDIQFIPDAESCKMPIMSYSPNENQTLVSGSENEFCWLGEYFPLMVLGNADDYPDLDLGEFPDDGSFVKVKITVEGIHCRNLLNFRCGCSATIVDLEIV